MKIWVATLLFGVLQLCKNVDGGLVTSFQKPTFSEKSKYMFQ